jgi:hypothetical protein
MQRASHVKRRPHFIWSTLGPRSLSRPTLRQLVVHVLPSPRYPQNIVAEAAPIVNTLPLTSAHILPNLKYLDEMSRAKREFKRR